MTEKTYYERYWKKEFSKYGGGVSETPPEWNAIDLKRILGFCDSHLHGRILDVGCGEGFFTNHLCQISGVDDVYGIDISDTAIKHAQGKYPHIKFRQGDLSVIPYEDSFFDVITMVEVIEHIVDVEAVISEISRVIKHNGLFIITTTDFNWLKKIIIASFYFEKYFYPTNPHIRFFTHRSLTKIITNYDFAVEKYAWNGNYMGLMPKGQIVLAKKG